MQRHRHIQVIEQILDHYQAPGLTVLLDGDTIDLTYPAIQAAAEQLQDDTVAIPPDCRAATDFQACKVCPYASSAALCHALPAILPFLDAFNPHKSYQRVMAVYVGSAEADEPPVRHVVRTSLQRALQFVALQSVLNFCEVGRLYRRFFVGLIPFAGAREMAERIYANVMLDASGQTAKVRKTVQEMRETLTVTMQCQIKRLRLVSRSDAFANAFVNLHLALQMLEPECRRGSSSHRRPADASEVEPADAPPAAGRPDRR